jgi:hypothetical protein
MAGTERGQTPLVDKQVLRYNAWQLIVDESVHQNVTFIERKCDMTHKLSISKYLSIVLAIVVLAGVFVLPVRARGFVHGIVIEVDGTDYYLAGPPDGPSGERDVPGHYWVQAGPRQLVGKHYNGAGPFDNPPTGWWSSDAADDELLFIVHGIIDTWTPENAERYASRGYVHYHELTEVDGGELHPTKIVWLRHTARTSFTLDGGPHPPADPPYITPGVAYDFLLNYMNPYNP